MSRFYSRNREPMEKKYRRLKAKYAENPPTSLRMAVINCYFFAGLTLEQTAEILGITTERVSTEIDTARQDSQ